jgi:hypothetical protein
MSEWDKCVLIEKKYPGSSVLTVETNHNKPVLGGSSSSSSSRRRRTSHHSNVKKPRHARERAVQPPLLKEGGVERQWPAVVQVGVPTPTAKRHTRGFATNRAAIAAGPVATPMVAPPPPAAAAAAAAHNLQTVREELSHTQER